MMSLDGSVGYQVYLRSFADASGDGVGDLPGLRNRLDHLAWLGVDLLWMTPHYPSPMRDHGYDVADYLAVEPRFGTMADLDAMVARAHDLGIRVLVDLVPNHTSSDHPWFQSALASRDSVHRDWYLWRNGTRDGRPPNNWTSHFGGPAWTLDEASGQWWCHLFLPEQPDLNWRNPAVADAFDDILRFWLDRGVDGFRIDVAHSLIKHPDMPDNPLAPERDEGEGPVEVGDFARFEHVHDVDQPEVLDIYRRWRRIADEYGAILLGEVYLLTGTQIERYLSDGDGLHLAFWFPVLHRRWDADRLRDVLDEGLRHGHGRLAWVQGSHDRTRAVTRFGDGDVGRARALALATLMIGLPGVPVIYQGEELGLEDGLIPPERAQDPIGARAHEYGRSRDGCRTPMLWEPAPGWGFTDAPEPWLPFGDRRAEDTVAFQRQEPASMLHRYRRLIRARR